MKISINKNHDTIELDLPQGVFTPSLASTVLLFAVEDQDIKNKNIADIGCGSGYLGLSLLRRGAVGLYGMDVQEEAITASYRNAALNHLEDKVSFKPVDFMKNDFYKFFDGNNIDVVIMNPPQTPLVLCSLTSNTNINGGVNGNECLLHLLDKCRWLLLKDGIVYFPVFSYSSPEKTKETATLYFKQVNVMATHDIPMNILQCEIIRDICKKGNGHFVTHYDYPYLRYEILRCQYPKTNIHV